MDVRPLRGRRRGQIFWLITSICFQIQESSQTEISRRIGFSFFLESQYTHLEIQIFCGVLFDSRYILPHCRFASGYTKRPHNLLVN
ncbi:MAG: hypothetical protein RIQ62_1209 [Bacteroidota bacterium]|jgi:hypothetical protein